MAAPTQRDPGPRLSWRYLAHSEVGKVRKNNQDSGLAADSMLAVADGMGGAAAGDLASAITVDALKPVAAPSSTSQPADGDDTDPLTEALARANARIADLIDHEPSLDGMGTTATAAVLDGDQLQLAHIGDSRAYLFRDGGLQQLTHDHSWVQSLLDDGRISAAEANVHPHRSLLLKVINGQPGSTPDVSTEPLRRGDRLLLCSDGLCGFVADNVIEDALTGTDRDGAMRHLIAASYEAGGLDNITIIVADVFDPATETAVTQDGAPEPVGPGEDSPPDGVERLAGPTGEVRVLGAAAGHDTAALEANILRRVSGSDGDPDAGDDHGAGTSGGEDGSDDGHPPDEDRYAPQPPGKRRFLKPLIALLAAFLVVAAAAGVGYAWTRTQYYVGVDGKHVAIYQGLDKRPAGVPLSRVYQVQRLRTDDLPHYYRDLVHGTIEADSLSAAHGTVTQLRVAADHCRTPKHHKKGGASATAKPSSSKSHGKHASKPKSGKQTKSHKHKPSHHKSGSKHTSSGKHGKTHKSPADSTGQLPGKGRC